MNDLSSESTGQDGFPPIAVVGMACRFSGGASSPSKLWDMLADKKSGRSVVPKSRFNIDAFHHPDPSRAGAVRHISTALMRMLIGY